MKSQRNQLLSFLTLCIFILACQSSDESSDATEGSADPATTEIQAEEAPVEIYNTVIGQMEDEIPVLIETRGILTAALEDKLGDEISLDPELIFIGTYDDSRHYLEIRGDRDNIPVLVALELQIDEKGILTSRSDAKLYTCVANTQSGLPTFKTEAGMIVGCECVDADTPGTCELTVLENVALL